MKTCQDEIMEIHSINKTLKLKKKKKNYRRKMKDFKGSHTYGAVLQIFPILHG